MPAIGDVVSVRGCVCPLRVCLSVVVKNFTVNVFRGCVCSLCVTLLKIVCSLAEILNEPAPFSDDPVAARARA